MKLGLYGGGFKPFHTGHFAKLLLALDESDKVLSFHEWCLCGQRGNSRARHLGFDTYKIENLNESALSF